LEALYKLNPVEEGVVFIREYDYPRTLLQNYSKQGDVSVVEATFDLLDSELSAVEAELGQGVLGEPPVRVNVTKHYSGQMLWSVDVDEEAIVRLVAGRIAARYDRDISGDPSIANLLDTLQEVKEDLLAEAEQAFEQEAALPIAVLLDDESGLGDKEADVGQTEIGAEPLVVDEQADTAGAIIEIALPPEFDTREIDEQTNFINKLLSNNGDVSLYVASKYLEGWLPKFVYFSEYHLLPGTISIEDLRKHLSKDKVTDGERTFLSLLKSEGAALEAFKNEQNSELAGIKQGVIGAAITERINSRWSQNEQLSVELSTNGTEVSINIADQKHGNVKVLFSRRSTGFKWFFSFMAYFAQFENDPSVVLLLDEPGLSLHASAQEDLLRYINGVLAKNESIMVGNPDLDKEKRTQIIYTTHSPFMIEADRLDRVRVVQDIGVKGTKISGDLVDVDVEDSGAYLPLQAALGYHLSQTLFVKSNCLFVEGPSDIDYLAILKEAVAMARSTVKNLTMLKDGWAIIPLGGHGEAARYINILKGNKLKVAAVLDYDPSDKKLINNIKPRLEQKRILLMTRYADPTTNPDAADIEDLFDRQLYLDLVNGAFNCASHPNGIITLAELGSGSQRITVEVGKCLQARGKDDKTIGKYSHDTPSRYMMQNHDKFLARIVANQPTLERASRLFEDLNNLLAESQRA